jgi:hypothetical protein
MYRLCDVMKYSGVRFVVFLNFFLLIFINWNLAMMVFIVLMHLLSMRLMEIGNHAHFHVPVVPTKQSRVHFHQCF